VTGRPVVIDCDPGIDDALALLLACASPEIDLVGVTTVCGNVGVELTTRNALRVLALAGRPDVPVAAGASRALVRSQPRRATEVHGADGIGGVPLVDSSSTVDERPAVRFLADTVLRSADPVTLVAVGPLTNVALFFASYPDQAARLARLVVLGGSVGAGNVTPAAEFNVWTDPEAAYRVLTDPGLPRGVPTVLIGLEVTESTAVGETEVGRLRDGGPAGQQAARMLGHYLGRYQRDLGRPAVVVHDAVAVAEAVRPGLVRTAPCAVTVDCTDGPGRGSTVVDRDADPDRPGGRPVEVGMAADAAEIIGMIVGRIADHRSPLGPPIG
jgi:pyrimidine-specific ribonucleoside hydrolase